ncbi:hypothetical protein DIPPA_00187 [Diplonema papillatum]|nr:hypothetical protein DIPPA_00187 [Diplonema papillatum]|eukprot:gene8994-13926_t
MLSLRPVALQQARRCTTAAKWATDKKQTYFDHLDKAQVQLVKERARVRRRQLTSPTAKEEDTATLGLISKQLDGLRNERLQWTLYPDQEPGLNKFEVTGNERQFAPSSLTPEEAAEAGVRDINDDMCLYDTALATLNERGTDVMSLFKAVGCPSPVVVMYHLLAKCKAKQLRLDDRTVAVVVDQHAGELEATLRKEDSEEDREEASREYVKAAFKMKQLCLDANVPFERSAHTALLRVCVVARDLEKACEVFQELVPRADEEQYGLMMQVAVDSGEPDFAIELFDEMRGRGFVAHERSTSQAVAAYAAKGDIPAALRLREEYSTADSPLKPGGSSAADKGQAKEGSEKSNVHKRATHIVDRQVLRALCMAGELQQALRFVEEVMPQGTVPSNEILSQLIDCAGKANNVAAGIALLERQRDSNLPTRLDNIHSLLHACVTTGDTDVAFALLKLAEDLRLKPTDSTAELILRAIIQKASNTDAIAAHDSSDKLPPPTSEPSADYHYAVEWMQRHQLFAASEQTLSLTMGTALAVGDTEAGLRCIETAKQVNMRVPDPVLAHLLMALSRSPLVTKGKSDALQRVLSVYREVRSPQKAPQAMFGLYECCLSSDAPATMFTVLATKYPGIEDLILGTGLLQGSPCTAFPELVQCLRGLGKVFVLSSLDILREFPAEASDCNKLFIPFFLLAEARLDSSADKTDADLPDDGTDDVEAVLALPHAEVIRGTEQLLANTFVQVSHRDLAPGFDFSLRSHRLIAFTALLSKAGSVVGCDVQLLARRQPGAQADLADRLNVNVLRL